MAMNVDVIMVTQRIIWRVYFTFFSLFLSNWLSFCLYLSLSAWHFNRIGVCFIIKYIEWLKHRLFPIRTAYQCQYKIASMKMYCMSCKWYLLSSEPNAVKLDSIISPMGICDCLCLCAVWLSERNDIKSTHTQAHLSPTIRRQAVKRFYLLLMLILFHSLPCAIWKCAHVFMCARVCVCVRRTKL